MIEVIVNHKWQIAKRATENCFYLVLGNTFECPPNGCISLQLHHNQMSNR